MPAWLNKPCGIFTRGAVKSAVWSEPPGWDYAGKPASPTLTTTAIAVKQGRRGEKPLIRPVAKQRFFSVAPVPNRDTQPLDRTRRLLPLG